MKNKLLLFLTVLAFCLWLTGCGGEDPEIKRFMEDIDSFCSEVAAIDAGINEIDAQSESAKDELLSYLDQLDQSFQTLAAIPVPADYSYMEELADEASSYMTTAVSAYHEAFGENSYNEYTADYARQNYERAYKRVTVILKLLHGEDISNEGATIESVE
ncbi:MAG: hypothetical protein HDQ99_14975 [Lachnospiraceae bacterium]|nr:hypothetical protein [Lachnospiraceae bacterium]